jgi:hypothetical protein
LAFGLRRSVEDDISQKMRDRVDPPEHLFPYARVVADLPTPELVENRRRSIAMLPPGAPALNRDEALELLEQLDAALRELRDLRRQLR